MGTAQTGAENLGDRTRDTATGMSERDPDSSSVSEAATPAKARLQPELVNRAREGGRRLWAGMVVLATLGGALGLLQFVTPNESAPVEDGDIVLVSQTRILDMVEQGTLSTDDAERLARALVNPSEEEDTALADTELGPEISRTGTAAQKAAFALLMEPGTRAQGIQTWHDAARSARDWEMLAELTMDRETDVARQALRNALSLDVGNVQTLAKLADAENALGNTKQARRSIETARALADTDEDRLVVGLYLVRFAIARDDWTDMQSAIYTLNSAVEALAARPDADDMTAPSDARDLREHTAYGLATGRMALAEAFRFDGRREEARVMAASASQSLLDIAQGSSGVLRRKLRREAADGYSLIAQLEQGRGKLDDAIASQALSTDLVEANYGEDPVFYVASAYTDSVMGLADLHIAANAPEIAHSLTTNHLALMRGRVRYGINDAEEIAPIVDSMAMRQRAAALSGEIGLTELVRDDLRDVAEIVGETTGDLRTQAAPHYTRLLLEGAQTLAVDGADPASARDLLHSELRDDAPLSAALAAHRQEAVPHIHLTRAEICHLMNDVDGAKAAVAAAERSLAALGTLADSGLPSRIAGLRAAITVTR